MTLSKHAAFSRNAIIVLIFGALAWTFWLNAGWLKLCGGLALFLFGMKNLEQGLKSLAGSQMKRLMSYSTATAVRGLLFGMLAAFVLQSTTLVSLLIIAFIGAGLLTLTGGIAILLGANLGATSGIWLLAIAGQNLSMAPLAMPLLVFGVLLGFAGERPRALGLFLLGISLIFLGIDWIKGGFAAFGDLPLNRYKAEGTSGALLFVGIGTLITVIVQSTHATLMLTLAALASQHLDLPQALAIAIGSNVGSSVTTAAMGMIGSPRSGQRLAIAHVLFNGCTAILSFALLKPLTALVIGMTTLVGLGENTLIQLTLFHTIFNGLGVVTFWPFQQRLADTLTRWLPDRQEPTELTTSAGKGGKPTRARYLQAAALQTVESARLAIGQEVQHMGRLALEVVAQALYQPVGQLDDPQRDDPELQNRIREQGTNADALYKEHIKPVYAELLQFMVSAAQPLDEREQDYWRNSQITAFHLVETVKEARRLQRSLHRRLLPVQKEDGSTAPLNETVRNHYLDLRYKLLLTLGEARAISLLDAGSAERTARIRNLEKESTAFEASFRQRLFADVRQSRLDSQAAGKLMNDLGAAHSILVSLRETLQNAPA